VNCLFCKGKARIPSLVTFKELKERGIRKKTRRNVLMKEGNDLILSRIRYPRFRIASSRLEIVFRLSLQIFEIHNARCDGKWNKPKFGPSFLFIQPYLA
jgi:hypothetical protein